jgi:hypothetical protein
MDKRLSDSIDLDVFLKQLGLADLPSEPETEHDVQQVALQDLLQSEQYSGNTTRARALSLSLCVCV